MSILEKRSKGIGLFMKKRILIGISTAILIASNMFVYGEVQKDDDIKIYVNGGPITMNDKLGNVWSPIWENGSIYLPLEIIAQAFGKEVKWDEETKSVHINDKNFFDEQYQNYMKDDVPLIASLPQKGLKMYGIKPKGILLFKNDGKGSGSTQYFDWDYLTPRLIFPWMESVDINLDGKEEIVVDLYVSSGTDVAIEQLHVLTIGEQQPQVESYIDHIFLSEDYMSQIKKILKYNYEESSNTLNLDIDGNQYQCQMGLSFQKGNFKDLTYGNMIKFYIEGNTVMMKAALGGISKEFATPTYFGILTAKIQFQGGRFWLVDFQFSEDDAF